MLNIDLHTHSSRSDGRLAPAELIKRAADAGVQVLALTDHDSMDGLGEAHAAAADTGLKIIEGVEVSVSWRNRSIHIVGLGFSQTDSTLLALLRKLQQARDDRAQKMAAKLEKLGARHCLERVQAMAGSGQVTRTHFARLLVEDGLCKDMQDVFKRYLRPGRPGHVKGEWVTMEDCVNTLHQAGGVAVLAHPLSYGMTAAWQDRLLTAFRAAGGAAMEVVCGAYNPEQLNRCAELARKHKLEGSVGSDFHAPEQRWLKLGRPLRLPPDIAPVWSRWPERLAAANGAA